ncbi:MAG: tetratricopeptide repeat protein [Candidatus Krumholzibacteria bacterium]
MKNRHVTAAVRAMALVCGVLLGAALASAGANAEPQETKVIKTTTDSRGFDKRHTEVDLMYETARQFIAAGQHDKAVVELEKVLKADGSRFDALHDLGTCYKQLKQFDKASAAYERAVALYPEDTRLLANLGYYQLLAKDYEAAMKTYEGILDKEPENYDASVRMGFLYQGYKKYAEALTYYAKALELKSDDVQTMGSMAKIYFETGENQKGLEMYERAIPVASEKDAAKLRSQLGKAYIETRQFDKSAVVFADLVAAEPGKASYRFNLGVSLMQVKRYADAIPELEKAAALKPDFCATYQPLATSYEQTKQYRKAISIARQGLEACESGKKAALYYAWGKGLEGLARHDEAIEKFRMAVKDPQWGTSAKKQIQRQQDLIKRAAAMKNK